MLGSYIYEGYFEDGRIKGYGRWIWSDGTVYEGEMNGLTMNGKGKLT
jgi:hypothetical protein